MAIAPIPTPYTKWAGVVIKLAEFVIVGYLEDLLSFGDESSEATTWRRVSVKFTGVSAGWDSSDDCYISIDIANVTSGALDDTWTSSDFATCETIISTFLTATASYRWNGMKASEYRWYRREFDALGAAKPFVDSGPPVRVQGISLVGGIATNQLQPQAAISFTERTAWPKHWGRFYLPGLAVSLGSDRQLSSGTVTTLATAFNTMYDDLMDAEFVPVVPVTQVQKQPARALLSCTKTQVDSIVDVVRRRRPSIASTKSALPV